MAETAHAENGRDSAFGALAGCIRVSRSQFDSREQGGTVKACVAARQSLALAAPSLTAKYGRR